MCDAVHIDVLIRITYITGNAEFLISCSAPCLRSGVIVSTKGPFVRFRSARSAAAVVLASIAPVSVVIPARAADPAPAASAFTVTTLHFKADIGPNKQGDPETCDIIGDVYVPETATAVHPSPALMATN